MQNKARNKLKTKNMILSVLMIIIIVGMCMVFCITYVKKRLLLSDETSAINSSMMIVNNFSITDEEVEYMKSLSFNEMETDPINYRLAEVATGIDYAEPIISVYLVAPLSDMEIKYTVDDSTADFFGATEGTQLDAVWLLNMAVNEEGKAVFKQRDDIYRYTVITEELQKIFSEKKSYGIHSVDEWGDVITGYTPVYTTEGNFVGMLGVDYDYSAYDKKNNQILAVIALILFVSMAALLLLFLWIYRRYSIEEKNNQEMIQKEEESLSALKIEQAAGKAKTDFLATMSHDMRTPMNVILGIVTLMLDEEHSVADRSNLNQIQLSGQYLLNLINDTLDLNKISANKLELHPVITDSRKVMENIISNSQLLAREKGVLFEVEKVNPDQLTSELLYIDSARVEQISVNIISNAIKFTPIGGMVRVTMERLETTEEAIVNRYQVIDTGIGMSQDFLQHIYEPFVQEGRSETRREEGTGLGMTIVHRLIELMNGTIEVSSTIGEGTTFTITLRFPKFQGYVEEKNVLQQEPINLEGIHALLVEDHPLNCQIAVKLLEKKGMIVDTAENGQIGVELYRQSENNYYSVILMDIRMPVMDGLTAAKEIRNSNREDSASIPIIAMTANAFDDDVKACIDAGMNDHISKPIEVAKMYKTIENQLKTII